MINPWKILGVHRQMEPEDVRKAYINLAKQHHPDAAKRDAKKFSAIAEAYSLLKDRKKLSIFLRQATALYPACTKCHGEGARSENVGFRIKIFKRCDACDGAGIKIREG